MFEFLESIALFFQVGIYEWFEQAAKYLTQSFILWYIDCQIWGLQFAWEVAQGVLTSLNASQHIASGMAMLSPEVSAGINFFRVPEALNLLLTAGMTRFVMNMIPGL